MVKIKTHGRDSEYTINQRDKRRRAVHAENSNYALAWKMNRNTLCVHNSLVIEIMINEESKMINAIARC